LVLGSQSASLVTIGLKDIVHRARPSPDLVGVFPPLSDPSFPSGHVVQYTMLFGAVFFFVYVLAQQSSRRTAALVLLAWRRAYATQLTGSVEMTNAHDKSAQSCQPYRCRSIQVESAQIRQLRGH
jgi:hypothetical protein